MRLAEQEGVPLWKIKRITPYREFVLWRAKWDYDEKEQFKKKDKLDYYLAQIAREVRVVLYKNNDAKKVSVNDMILQFRFPEEEKKKRTIKVDDPRQKLTPEQEAELIKKNTERSQTAWFKILGLNRKKVLDGT